jgi:hypothetical protein
MTTRNPRNNHPTVTRRARNDGGAAFLPDPYDGTYAKARTKDALAEELAEEFVISATGAEEAGAEERDRVLIEEAGGPFVESSAQQEFAQGTDPSNPITAERAPFPTVMGTPRAKF